MTLFSFNLNDQIQLHLSPRKITTDKMIKYLNNSFSHNVNDKQTLLSKIICLLIFASICSVVLETEEEIYTKYKRYFDLSDNCFCIIFAIEYVLRIGFSGSDLRYVGFKGKIRYLFSPIAIIDFLAFAPSLFFSSATDGFFLRIIRLLRLLRIIRFANNTRSVFLFLSAIKNSKTQLIATLIVTMFILFVGAVLLKLKLFIFYLL